MKKLIPVLFLLLFFSCKKEQAPTSSRDPYLRSVLSHLKDSVTPGQFAQIDSSQAFLTDVPGKGYHIIRFGISGQPITSDFWLLKTDEAGNIQKGELAHMDRTNPIASAFSGTITLSSLTGVPLLQSTISNGYIYALHGYAGTGNRILDGSGRTVTVLPAPDADWLPEVIVVGYGSGGGSSSYISADGLLGMTSGGILAGGGQDGGGGTGGGGSSGGGDGGNSNAGNPGTVTYIPQEPPVGRGTSPFAGGVSLITGLDFEPEYMYAIETVDIRKYFNCFDQIPDEGATFSVQLCVDVPVNGNPAASSNASGLSAGHTFLIITKSGSGTTITQSFGYYPAAKFSIVNPFAELGSVIKNNQLQEINAQLSMSLSIDQFNMLKAKAIELSAKPYSLDKSNCTDFALGVVNSIRSSPITPPPYVQQQPGITLNGATFSQGATLTIANSPQGLFDRLQQMKSEAAPEASNILLDLSHNTKAPVSHGACN